jgi:hypothetical protein
LYYYGARWLDPSLGRFIQADTIVPDPGSPVSWDRYSYTFNRPTVLIDPSGHKACDAEFGCSDVAPPKTSRSSRDQSLTREEKKCGGGGCGLERINKSKEGKNNDERMTPVSKKQEPPSVFGIIAGGFVMAIGISGVAVGVGVAFEDPPLGLFLAAPSAVVAAFGAEMIYRSLGSLRPSNWPESLFLNTEGFK